MLKHWGHLIPQQEHTVLRESKQEGYLESVFQCSEERIMGKGIKQMLGSPFLSDWSEMVLEGWGNNWEKWSGVRLYN